MAGSDCTEEREGGMGKTKFGLYNCGGVGGGDFNGHSLFHLYFHWWEAVGKDPSQINHSRGEGGRGIHNTGLILWSSILHLVLLL